MSYEDTDDGLELENIVLIKGTPYYGRLIYVKSFAIKKDFYIVERLVDKEICHLKREEIEKKEEVK